MKIIKKFFPYFFFLLFSFLLNWVYFRGLKVGEFIFSGDQLLRLSYDEAFANSFFLRKMDHFGVFNSWQQIVQFWDSVYYLIVYKLGFSLLQIEFLSFFVALFISFSLSYLGFQKLTKLFKFKQSIWVIIVVTIWYCINPYTLVMWHGGVYNIGLALTYSLAPLILYYFDLAVFSDTKLKNKIICALLMFLASFTFWLFAVTVFFLGWYYLLCILLKRESFKKSIKQILILVLIFIPLSSLVIFTIIHEYLNNSADLNSGFVPTFGNQQGGMWYAFLMLFSWGIYTVWTPRTLYPFGDYLLSSSYKTVTIGIYLMILVGVILFYLDQQGRANNLLKNLRLFIGSKKNNFLLIFILLLLISIFFTKGAQPPLGNLFLFFYNYVPFFSVFRSADHRFGFAVVLSVAILLLYVSKKYKTYFFCLVLFLLTIFQSYPMFFGSAVRGENVKNKYYDRITHITLDYQGIADYLNFQNEQISYVLSIPSVEYGRYKLIDKENLIGQDLLPKIINKPFVYLSVSTGMDTDSAQELYKVVKNHDFESLKKFPIEYILLRKDITCVECLVLDENELNTNLQEVYKNNTFTLFKTDNQANLVSGANLDFQMINPVQFKVDLKNVKQNTPLILALSFNQNWKLYLNKTSQKINCNTNLIKRENINECKDNQSFFIGDELQYLFDKPLFKGSHVRANGFSNLWNIDTNYIKDNFDSSYYSINKDGTLNLSLTIYYAPQSHYYLYACISIFMTVALLMVLFFKRKKNN